MKITFPTKVAWRRYINDSDESFLTSKNKQRELNNFLAKTDDCGISSEIIVPDTNFYTWFVDMYRDMLHNKENALEFDVVNYQISDNGKTAPKKALILSESDQIMGATIFFECKNSINISFKVYKNKWYVNKALRIGPSLYSEYLLFKLTKATNRKYISLGIDRNPYGPNADIGLATYKFSANYEPRSTKKAEMNELDTDSINEDMLIFHTNTNESGKITEATLLAKDPDKYAMLLNKHNVEVLNVIKL